MDIMNKLYKKIRENYTTYYSFVIVPNNHKKYFQLKIPKLFAHLFLGAILIMSCYTLGVTIINKIIAKDINKNVSNITVLNDTDVQQKEYITDMEEQLKIMNEKLTQLEMLENHIKGIVSYEEGSEEEDSTEN